MSILNLLDKYPQIRSTALTDLNIRVFESLASLNSDYDILKYCFAINFYSKKYNDISCFDKNDKIICDLRKMANSEELTDPSQTSIDIYLRYIKCILDEKIGISFDESEYAFRLLSKSENEKLRSEVVDFLFKVSRPDQYEKITKLLSKEGVNLLSFFSAQNNLMISLRKTFERYDIKYEIESRIKTIYSLNEKINDKNLSLEQISDLLGLRIYLHDSKQCFEVMKIIVKEYEILKERFKDYISCPKENGYQSLHLVINYDSILIEIQIRSYEMHQNCEIGDASHIKYKKNRLKSGTK